MWSPRRTDSETALPVTVLLAPAGNTDILLRLVVLVVLLIVLVLLALQLEVMQAVLAVPVVNLKPVPVATTTTALESRPVPLAA